MKNKVDDFIGMTFPTPEGGILTVIGDNGLVGNSKKYLCKCNICSEDDELFSEPFEIKKGHLNEGRIPCACSRYKWSEYQNILRVKRECQIRGYTFNGWYGDYKGNQTRLNLQCNVDNNTWNSTRLGRFLSGSGCPLCNSNKVLRHVGETFKTPANSTLTIIGVASSTNHKRVGYICECDVCSKDEELWPYGSIVYALHHLKNGIISCGCSTTTNWTEAQNKIRIERLCKERDYIFHGWYGDYIGSHTKLYLESNITNNKWNTTSLTDFISGTGDPSKEAVSLAIKKFFTKECDYHIQDFLNAGFSAEYDFYRDANNTDIWNYTCPECSNDEYSKVGLCTGMFISTTDSLKAGSKSCRCSSNYRWNQSQREYQINKICNEEDLTFIGWNSNHGYKQTTDTFYWKCKQGHLCKTSVGKFINRSDRCKTCSDEAGEYGYYTDRVGEDDNLYLLLFKSDTEIFIKVGRSFDIKERMREFYKHYEDVSVIVTYQNNHQVVYDTEQSIHKQLKLLDYHHKPEIKFGGSKNECFHIDSLPLIEEIFSNLNK